MCVDELRALSCQLTDGAVYPVLLRPGPGWTADIGLVTDGLTMRLPDLGDADHYVAGPPVMVDGVAALLRDRGVPLDRLHFDRFG